ncbi:hypothetical protein M5J20_05395 [Corynebacterium sp. TA-R-1]|uniref:Uncharacterized protein n=1 Tax=Corynebacterium stercoris TaxID=2943490 RepID=A0ABT1G199_9CORY|nr:hypothetical protein [Corynebacterium stercoris]MCP1387622.1 hypothetical protein [Corynebacterium stercoris]
MFKNTATRRGTAIAAAVLSLAMVAPSITPAAAQNNAPASPTATVTPTVDPINLAPATAAELAAILKDRVIEAYPGETVETNLKAVLPANTTVSIQSDNPKQISYKNGVLKVAVPADAKANAEYKFTLTLHEGTKAEQANVTVKVIEKSEIKTLAPTTAPAAAEKTVAPGKAESFKLNVTGATLSNLKAKVDKDGAATVKVEGNKVIYTVSKDAKEGDKFNVEISYTLTYPGGLSRDVTKVFPVVVGKAEATSTTPTSETSKTTEPTADASSKLPESCKQILPLAGIPLLALIPAGLLSQIALGSSANVTNVINQQIRDFNAEIQRQAGILNPELAAAIESADKFLQAYGYSVASATVGLASLAGGIAAAAVILNRCLPDATGGTTVEAEAEISKETKEVLDQLKGSSEKLRGSSVKAGATSTPTATTTPTAPADAK